MATSLKQCHGQTKSVAQQRFSRRSGMIFNEAALLNMAISLVLLIISHILAVIANYGKILQHEAKTPEQRFKNKRKLRQKHISIRKTCMPCCS